MSDRVFRCRQLTGTTRCGFEGDNTEAGAHWQETGHGRCIVCSDFLRDDEALTCLRCVAKVRTCLVEIPECVALAEDVIVTAGFRGSLPIDLLAMVSDGSIESPVQQANPDAYRYVEQPNDPLPVVAVLYGIERCWREEFGHGPRMSDATISGCADYLLVHLQQAARAWLGFDDDAATVKQLANRLRHAVGVADDPVEGTKCLDCPDVTLVRPYRQPIWPVPDRRRSQDGYRGIEPEGLDDLWHCRSCKRDYTPAEYGLALRQRAAEARGWVTVALASEVTGRHRRVIIQWVHRRDDDGNPLVRMQVDEDHRRMVVWMPDVTAQHEKSAQRGPWQERTLTA